MSSRPAAHPLRRALRASQAAVLLVAMMFLGSLVLWVGVPVAWLWIGSRLQNGTSLATAIGAMMIGMLLSVALLLAVLGWLSRRHTELQERRGVPESETTALELRPGLERRRRGDRLPRVVLRVQRLEPDTHERELLIYEDEEWAAGALRGPALSGCRAL